MLEMNYVINTFYLLVMGILVMFMAAGFSMLECGLVRAKNTVEILTKNIALYAISCVTYMLIGYNLMYPSASLIEGVLPAIKLLVSAEHTTEAILAGGDGAPTHSARADFFFQVVFVATSMSVVSGAVAERMRLWSFLIFSVVMTGFIYPIQGYWSWGGGFLSGLGFKDFAGSGVVHLTGATAALAAVLLLGARKGKFSGDGRVNPMQGANLPLATLGTLILWFGWFGFNGGSQLQLTGIDNANAIASTIVNTNMAACGGLISALTVSRLLFGKADLTMILNGALAGLVAITAEPTMPTPILATMIGAIGGVLVVFGILALDKIKIDDPVGAISVHGAGGLCGLLAVPMSNHGAKFFAQLVGSISIALWVFAVSFAVWYVLNLVIGLRVTEEEEYEGMDVTECGMEAYPEFIGSNR